VGMGCGFSITHGFGITCGFSITHEFGITCGFGITHGFSITCGYQNLYRIKTCIVATQSLEVIQALFALKEDV
jgi:hypothetical protein